MLEKTMRLNYLFDFYRSLLTKKQREYMTLYYLEDYSLVEIAEYARVSRQAVYDNLKRTEKVLENYEEKLMLYEKFQRRTKMLKRLERALKNEEDLDEQLKYVHQLIDIG